MPLFNLHNKRFQILSNTDNGKVDQETTFHFHQEENIISAYYEGGPIKKGNIVGKISGDEMSILYHCLTTEDTLKAGKAAVKITQKSGKLHLYMNWEWLSDQASAGQSVYVEVD